MNIGQAAKASGVSSKMIRYYERVGLVRPADRTVSNYRSFGLREVHELRFISRARALGVSVEEIANLLSLWRDRGRPSSDVKVIADTHLADFEARIADMEKIADTLRELSASCAGDKRPEGPTLPDPPEAPVDLSRAQPQASSRRSPP
jgi:MerR family copper efflux transcriptional regulator